jgi:myo-inositol-1(or 4)-monophosphatase
MDTRGLAGRPLVAGNLKLVDALQAKIVNTGYATALD